MSEALIAELLWLNLMWPFKTRDLEETARILGEHNHFIIAYDELLVELFADRGMLLGSERFKELSGVEQFDALNEIDSRISRVKDIKEKEGLRYRRNLKY